MSFQLVISQLQYSTCSKHHEELSMVCREQRCQATALICPICESNHQGHQIIPLRQFLGEFKILNDEEAIKLALQLQTEINKTKHQFESELCRLKQQFQSNTYELQTKIDKYFNDVNQKCYDSFQNRSKEYLAHVLQICSKGDRVTELVELIERLKKYDVFSLQEEISYYKISTEKKLKGMIDLFQKLNVKTQFKQAKELFTVSKQPYNQFNYEWSSYRAPTIAINENVAIQKSSSSNGERFALLQPRNGHSNQIKIRFKINKLKGWIGIGICLKQTIINAGYKFNYTQPFHGSYLISANGYSWSHSRPEYNSAYKSFIFHEGDIIEVYYNATEERVSFQNKQNSSKFMLSTVPIEPSKQDYYVPCVNLCNAGDEVEIINGKQ